MKTKNLFRCVLMAVMTLYMFSCEKGSEGNGTESGGGNVGSDLIGWYTDLSSVAKTSDFNVINQAINNQEVLSSYHYGGSTHTYIASYDYFISSDGMYSDSDANAGRLRFTIDGKYNPINVIRIMNDKTLLYYVGWLYIDGYGSGDAVYRLYAGPIFGNMTYYGDSRYYSYIKNDNKIIVSNGDIYTIIGSQLIQDGSSRLLSKYDPTVRY